LDDFLLKGLLSVQDIQCGESREKEDARKDGNP
jgi:hypothetical protein